MLQQLAYEETHPHRQDHQQVVARLEDFAANSKKVYGFHDKTAASSYIFYWLIRHGNVYDTKIS